jgi:hypothetical protein
VASLAMVFAFLGGCATTPIPPTYTQDELKAICERHGARWRPDVLMGAYCEHDSPCESAHLGQGARPP